MSATEIVYCDAGIVYAEGFAAGLRRAIDLFPKGPAEEHGLRALRRVFVEWETEVARRRFVESERENQGAANGNG